jgi:outer membrane immunogenic protein
VKKLLISAALIVLPGWAAAADLSMRAPVYRPASPALAVYGWSGCYLGAQGGGAFGQSRHDTDFGSTSDSYAISGGVAGGTAGCNYQMSRWVLGLEGDFSWTSKRGSAIELAPFPATFTSQTRENWLGTVRGRVGFAADRWLFYVTGGYAVAAVEAGIVNPVIGLDVTDTKIRNGFTVGAGIEGVISGPWSAKLEYLYVGLQNASYFDVPPPAVFARTGVPISDNIFRAGINYHFGGPVAGK